MIVAGLDLGGTKALFRVEDNQGRLLHEARRETGRQTGPDEVIHLIASLLVECAPVRPSALGIGFPGLADSLGGIARSSAIIDGWTDVSLAKMISDRFDMACALDNDVNNAARAELAARGPDGADMLFLTVGSGVGGALVLAGALWRGASGLAGEVGHIAIDREGPVCLCGRIGCAGPRASVRAITQRLGVDGEKFRQLAEAQDSGAWAAIEDAAELLGRALASAINLLNLPLVVIGGGMAELGERYRSMVEQAMRREAFDEIAVDCRVELAQAGYEAGARGAVLLAREAIGEGAT